MINSATYDAVMKDLEGRFFTSGAGSNTTWILDRNSPDLLLTQGEIHIVGRLKPDGSYRTFVKQGFLENDYWVNSTLCHIGVTSARLIRLANMDPHYELYGPKVPAGKLKVKTGGIYLDGAYIQLEKDDEPPRSDNLRLECIVPDEFIPQELSKVPRKLIAQMRDHVTKMFELAKIADKVSGKNISRYDLWGGSGSTASSEIKRALTGKDLKERGRLMATEDMMFWRFARAFYASPASLIDSCRAEFYNAAGVRPVISAQDEPKFTPINVAETATEV